MSTDITVKTTSTDMIDIEKLLAEEAALLQEQLAKPSGKKISIKGKKFTLPDKTVHEGPLTAIIIDFVTINRWYEGRYNPKEIESPACWAIGKIRDSLVASEHSTKRQGENCDGVCANCPKNKWESKGDGSKAKACKNGYRIAIVPVDCISADEIMTLEIPPTSLKTYENFVRKVQSDFGAPPIRVAVDISFVESEEYPTLTFSNMFPHKNLVEVFALRQAASELLYQEPASE